VRAEPLTFAVPLWIREPYSELRRGCGYPAGVPSQRQVCVNLCVQCCLQPIVITCMLALALDFEVRERSKVCMQQEFQLWG
jgi:hypothetical protein